MKRELFGHMDGTPVYAYTLANEALKVRIGERGAAVLSIVAFGKEIAGGYDRLEDYLADNSNQGVVIGRVANRIEGACFTMDGVTYHLPKNNGENCVHGGRGFQTRLFSLSDAGEDFVTLNYRAADGEEGFPMALDVCVTYRLTGTSLVIDYRAIPDGKTPIALTNHTYFNLDGLGGTVDGHLLMINADRYTAVSDALIPTGEHPPVAGTVFDFRTPHTIGGRDFPWGRGYDHNFVLNSGDPVPVDGFSLPLAATLENETLTLEVYTDQPCLQIYTDCYPAGNPDFRGGVKRILRDAIALETQTEPNCVKHGTGFYDKGEVYRHTTAYRFGRKV